MPPHPDLLLSLSPSLLRDLVTTFSSPSRSPSPPPSPFSLPRTLFTRVPTKKLSSLLTRLTPFSTPRGRLALLEAAHAISAPAPASPSLLTPLTTLPPADAAATLFLTLERTTSPSHRRLLRRLFALASLRVARDLPERPTYELLTDPALPAPLDAARLLTLLRRPLGARLVDTWDARDPDGSLRLALFLEQLPETRLPRPAKNRPITPHAETTVAADVLHVSPDGARVALTLAEPHLLPLYASALSLSLRPSISLRPLQTLSPAALSRIARATRGLKALDVVGARHRRPGDSRVEVRGPDALAPTDLGPRTGYIDRATLRATTDDAADVDAFLQLPYRVEIDARAREPFRAALSTLGVFSPGALPDDARSLALGEHGDWRWRGVVGDATFDRLCKAKILVRTQSKHVASHEYRMHGAGYVVRDVPGAPDLQYALAEDRALGARLVGPRDRVAWRLDPRALTTAMMRDLGAHAASSPLALPGVLDLGVVALKSGKLRIVYAMAEPPAGWLDALRRAAGVAMTPVVLVPKGHAGEGEGQAKGAILEVELALGEQLGAVRVGRVLGRIAEGIGLEEEVDAWMRYDEEIVVEAASQRTWVTGVLVPFRDRAYGLIFHLAKRGAVVATKEVGASISSAGAPDVTARKARAEALAAARRAGVDAAIVARMVLVEGRKGYRLGLGARVV